MKFWYLNQLSDRRLMYPKGDESDGGGGAGGGTDDKEKDKGGDDIKAMRAENAALLARLEKLEKRSTKTTNDDDDTVDGDDDEDLSEKARKMRAKDERKTSDAKALEAAITFNLKSPEFLKTNAGLLPKGVEDIFKAASSETFNSAIEKDQAIKEGLIKEFFAVQANRDLLTGSQKTSLDDYLKLTKNIRQERAQSIYDSIFEPTIEQLRRMKKADALKKGFRPGDGGTEDSYREKMINLSKKHYLGENKNA